MEKTLLVPAGTEQTLVIRIDPTEKNVEQTVVVEDEATCTVITINGSPAVSIKQQGTVKSGAKLRWQNISLGGKDVTHDVVSHVIGDNAESAVDWMFAVDAGDKQMLTVRNIFDGREGSGEILMRGVAQDNGYATAKGMIEIGLKGGGTNTYLTQEVLMLDPTAKIDAVPGLEIKTNDVKASHSATVARVSPEDLFYFASRGIPKAEARAMYIQGFLGAIAERITDAKTRDEVLEMIEHRVNRLKP